MKVGIGGGGSALKFLLIVGVGGSIAYLFLLESTGYPTPLHDIYVKIFGTAY